MKTMINSIDPSLITISERQRKTFPDEDHRELRESIQKHGLFHAPGLVSSKNPSLVFGHRRTLALKSLIEDGETIIYNGRSFEGEIPFVAVGELDDLQLKEIELSENLSRLDLTWQEKAKALSDLEALRNSQREQVAAITDSVPLDISIKELAEETNKSTATISESLAIASHLDDPDVQKAKSLKEAKKIIERKAKESYANEKAKSYDPSQSIHELIEGDCREAIKRLPESHYQAVVTDPPYGIDMHKDQSWDGTWHEYDDTEAYCLNLISSLLPEWDRVTTDEAHLYIFCDHSKFDLIAKIVEEHGVFKPMPYPFIWDKGNVASYPRPDHWPRKSYECILYAIKGDKPQNKLDLAVIPIPQTTTHEHPAGKPPELYAHLIKRSTHPGDHVLDCFAGEGTIFKAAKLSQVTATGIELSDKYISLAKNTLSELGE